MSSATTTALATTTLATTALATTTNTAVAAVTFTTTTALSTTALPTTALATTHTAKATQSTPVSTITGPGTIAPRFPSPCESERDLTCLRASEGTRWVGLDSV